MTNVERITAIVGLLSVVGVVSTWGTWVADNVATVEDLKPLSIKVDVKKAFNRVDMQLIDIKIATEERRLYNMIPLDGSMLTGQQLVDYQATSAILAELRQNREKLL
tara:strand:+ start:1049 stop:1369 length:321 start_codon:yes stop_codon:yes gene_type:complete